MKRVDSGFTLIELMVVLVIVGILLGIAVPNFVAMTKNYRLQAQTNDLNIAFSLARSEAIRRGTNVVVCKGQNAESGTFVCGSGPGMWEDGWFVFVDSVRSSPTVFDAGEQVLLVHGALTGGNTLTNNTGSTTVAFTPQGVTANFAGFTIMDTRGKPNGVHLLCLGSGGRTRVFNQPALFTNGTIACTGTTCTCPA